MAVKPVSRNSFGIKQNTFPVPNINQLQIDSFNKFWEEDLKDILAEFSPIEDSLSGRWRVTLGPEFYLEKDNLSEYEALLSGTTYGKLLYVNVGVENLLTKEKKTQRVFVGKVPQITDRGNFIVNGTQKIIVAQLVKSPGVIFGVDNEKGQMIYNAKIIPARGAWVDLEIHKDNAIYMKIDRKKKFPVTQLLRLFGLLSEEEILAKFADVDTDPNVSYMQATLAKDPATTQEEAINSIYKKVRPGDIVSLEQGKKYLLSLFEDPVKYDIGFVGRHKFDQRLNYNSRPLDGQKYKRTLSLEEFIEVIRELIRMKVQEKPADSLDSLSNRRVRGVGEWLGNTFRAGLARVVRNVKDKMVTSDESNPTPSQMVNMRPLAAMIEDFFNTSQLAKFMDQTNILSEMDDRQFLTAGGPGGLNKERAGFEVRDVHPSHYGRLCPVNTPEGQSFGLNTHLAVYARVNKMGFIETPYFKVKDTLSVTDPSLIGRIIKEDVIVNGKKIAKKGDVVDQELFAKLNKASSKLEVKVPRHVSNEVVWLDATEEMKYVIAEYIKDLDELGHFKVETVGARKEGNPVQVRVEEVDLMDVSANQIFSLSTCMIPFVAQTDGYRALMATNHQGQALPLVKPELPYVATGFERVAARDSGYLIQAPFDGVVTYADGFKVILKSKDGKQTRTFTTLKYLPSNNHSTINQKVVVTEGEEVQAGDILIEGFGITQGEFAIGQNVRVAFMPFKGYNFEDSIVLSERLIQKDKFTSTHIYEMVCDVHETSLGDEEITRDIPNVAAEKLRKLDKNGIVYVGAYVESGDILVGKITPKGEVDLSPEDKLIRVLFGEYSRDVKDSSLYLEHGLSGKVISVRIFSRENGDVLPSDVIKRVHIWLATTRKIKPGDKMAGRHGNKGVVSVVLPVEDMPYTADGRPVDVVLNPLGVIGRMNLGQLLETHLGLVCETKGMYAITQPLNEISEEILKEELKQAGFREDGKMELWDGQTGQKYDRPVVVGTLYLNKLHHLVDDKIHARSTGNYSLVTQQPIGGRSHGGGQRFGEMEVWALEAYGAAYALQEMLTIKSDDIKGREAAFEAIIKGKQIASPNLPGSFVVLANELTALGLKVNADVDEAEERRDEIDEKMALYADEGNLEK